MNIFDALETKEEMPNGCWEYRGPVSESGYGYIYDKGTKKTWGVHRLAWTQAYGEIPPKMCVCHKCDNRSCIRPDHLFLGTHRDNVLDKESKGRHFGEPGVREAEVKEYIERANAERAALHARIADVIAKRATAGKDHMPELVDADALAKILGISRYTVKAWTYREKRLLPALTVGKSPLYDVNETLYILGLRAVL